MNSVKGQAETKATANVSGHMIRPDKPGSMDPAMAPILLRISANPSAWHETITRFGSRFRLAAGLLANQRRFADQLGKHWLSGTDPGHPPDLELAAMVHHLILLHFLAFRGCPCSSWVSMFPMFPTFSHVPRWLSTSVAGVFVLFFWGWWVSGFRGLGVLHRSSVAENTQKDENGCPRPVLMRLFLSRSNRF